MNTQGTDDEIDLSTILKKILNNKILLILFTFSGFTISSIIALSTARTWQGEFQIVLDKKDKSNILDNKKFSNFTGISQSTSTLETEVEILRSPSVLMKVFEYVNATKNPDNIYKKNLRFKDWKHSLNVSLQGNTSVLNISYFDKDKNIIIPVLKKISNTYQDYSEKKRLNDINSGIKYVESQVEKYEEKSFNSIKIAQEFAMKNDLAILDDWNITNTISIENDRISASNKIRDIDQKLIQLKNADDPSLILYIASQLNYLNTSELINEELINDLKIKEKRLNQLKVNYTEADRVIQTLERERLILISKLKAQVINLLKAQKENAIALLKASKRPDGVLIKYKQLVNKAIRDQSTFNLLEDQLRSLNLEKARNQEPWELITNPTLLPNAVKPKRKRLALIGLLTGLVSGVGACVIKERNTIFSISDMKDLTQWKLITKISLKENTLLEENLELIKNNYYTNNINSIVLLQGWKENNLCNISEIIQKQNEFKEGQKYKLIKEVSEIDERYNLIILIAEGYSEKSEIININNKLRLKNKSEINYIYIDNIQTT